MEKQVFNFLSIQNMSLENSFGTIRSEEKVLLNVSIGINSSDYGWFEIYDNRTDGEKWYAEGSLFIKDKSITGYDGVFALPTCVVDKLQDLGFDVSEVE